MSRTRTLVVILASCGLAAGATCAGEWQRCLGGADYHGPNCCQAGLTCMQKNNFYGQCRKQGTHNELPHGWHGTPITARAWHQKIRDLGITHEVIHTHASDAQYTASGYFMAPLNTPYNPAQAKACCTGKCSDDDCESGCNMWLHSSSLNYESQKWWTMLEMKCKRDCMASVLWRHVDKRKPTETDWINQMHASYWSGDDARKTNDADKCRQGCTFYKQCMDSGAVAAYAACTCPNGVASTDACLKDATERCHHCNKGYYLTASKKCVQATCENGVIAMKDSAGRDTAIPFCNCNEGFVGGGRYISGGRSYPACEPQ